MFENWRRRRASQNSSSELSRHQAIDDESQILNVPVRRFSYIDFLAKIHQSEISGSNPPIDLGNPVVSEWIDQTSGQLYFTRFAFSCFAGVIIGHDGRFKVFHLPSTWSWNQAVKLLPASEVAGGIVGSQLSLERDVVGKPGHAPTREFYTRELGLTAVPNRERQLGSFNVALNPSLPEIIYSYGGF